MKRITAMLVLALFLLTLTSCTSEYDPTYTIEQDGVVYTVDTENQTISDGTYHYSYSFSGNTTTITYPNGAAYYWTREGNISTGGWSEDYDNSLYADGDILLDMLPENAADQRKKTGNPLLALVLLGFGIWNAVSPASAWYLSKGWQFKDAEPSDLALGLGRVSGVVLIVIGILILFV